MEQQMYYNNRAALRGWKKRTGIVRRIFCMKKLLALVLSLMMVFGCVAAMAEDVEMATIDFGDFLIDMPADWTEIELTEDQEAQGIVYASKNAEETRSITVSFCEDEVTAEAIAADLSANSSMSEVAVAEINGITLVSFTIAEMDQTGFIVPVEGGYYTFYFMRASDEGFAPIAQAMLASIALPAAE